MHESTQATGSAGEGTPTQAAGAARRGDAPTECNAPECPESP